MVKKPYFLRSSAIILVAFYLVGFTQPESNDLIQLTGGLFARSEAKFRTGIDDQNRVTTIESNARGIIRKVQEFRDDQGRLNGKSGLCVEFVSGLPKSAPKQDCYWVYYSKSRPALKLFGVAKKDQERESILSEWKGHNPPATITIVQSPRQADFAETIRSVSSIPNQVLITRNSVIPMTDTSGVDMPTANRLADNSVRTIIAVNNNASLLMQPSLSCSDGSCNRPSPIVGESCNANNSYQQPAIIELLTTSKQSEYFKNPQKEIITRSCVARNMNNFSASSTYFRTCAPNQATGGKSVPRACIDENYINVTAKAFNLSAECLGDYVAGYSINNRSPFLPESQAPKAIESGNIILSAKQQASLSIFSFMSQESGMHINAESPRVVRNGVSLSGGAGGPGQMTAGAVESVNNDLRNIRKHLSSRTDNPHCAKVLLPALETPLKAQGASCDRKDPKNIAQSMAYTFAYQAFIRRYLEDTVFDNNVFGKLVSTELSVQEKDRFMMEVTGWAHNTGPVGMKQPLAALMTRYTREGKKIRTSSNIDQFLKDLTSYMQTPERAGYYKSIQRQMAKIAPGGRNACIAN